MEENGEGDRRQDRPNMFYYFMYNEKTKELTPTKTTTIPSGFQQIKPTREDGVEGRWRWEIEKSKKNLSRLYARYMPNRRKWSVFEMDYFDEDDLIKPTTAWTKKDFNTERGTEQFIELGFKKEDFPKPKPVGLLKHILEFATDKNSLILDSFAGSGTTAQAVLELNKDGGNRKFILVECEDYADKITAERVRRVIKGVPKSKNENLRKGLGGSFSYFDLGDPIEMESILSGKGLPIFMELARYVFYTATGEEFDEKKVNQKTNFIGESKEYQVYLFYKPDLEYLKNTALTLDRTKELPKFNGKRRLVFAPTKYLDQDHLDQYHIDFAQLPFEIYKLAK